MTQDLSEILLPFPSIHPATESSSNSGFDSKNTIAEIDGGPGCLDLVESEREELERLRVEWAQQVNGMLASRSN